jgi:hypothetical protein
MRQELLMRRTKENACLEFYQGMQSFALLFVCTDTTAKEAKGWPTRTQTAC